MRNSQGAFQISRADALRHFDGLPPLARKALREAAPCLAAQPFRELAAAGICDADLARVIGQVAALEVQRWEQDRRMARDVYAGLAREQRQP